MTILFEKDHMDNWRVDDRHNFNIKVQTGGGAYYFCYAITAVMRQFDWTGADPTGSSSSKGGVTKQAAGVPSTEDYFLPKGNYTAADEAEFLYFRNYNQIWQVFRGFSEPDARIFDQIPTNQTPEGINQYFSTPGLTSPYGFSVEGRQSPIEFPTKKSMFFMLPEVHMQSGFANPSDIAWNLYIQYHINKINHAVWDPRTTVGKGKIIGECQNRIPALWYTPETAGYLYVAHRQEACFGNIPPVYWDGKEAYYMDPEGGKVKLI